jgi:hypothetical protein
MGLEALLEQLVRARHGVVASAWLEPFHVDLLPETG